MGENFLCSNSQVRLWNKNKNSSWLSLGVSVSYCYLSGSLLHAVETWIKNGLVLYAMGKVLMLLFQMKLNSEGFGKFWYSIKGCHLVATLTESLKSHCTLHYNSCRIKVRVTFFFSRQFKLFFTDIS